MAKLVSVIIPTYNRSSMIRRALASVISQDYTNLEIIVVDDCSIDDTVQIVKSYEDPRIRLATTDVNSKGAAKPRNVGLQMAKGQYVAFLDSDDEFLPCRISRMVEYLEAADAKVSLVFSNCIINEKKEEFFVSKAIPSGLINTVNSFPASVFCPPSCWLLRKNLIEDEYFDESIRVIEDCDFFARIARKHKAFFLNELLVRKHVHNELAGSVPIELAEQTRYRMLDKWSTEMKKDKKYAVDFYCTMAKDLLKVGKKSKAMDILMQVFKFNPLSGRVIGRILKTLLS